jgi:hypothetical protein
MKEQIKSEFCGTINGVTIKSQTNYYYFRYIVKELEKFFGIAIDDTDFVIFMQRFTEECFKYVSLIEPDINVAHVVTSVLSTFFERDDVDFKEFAIPVGKFFEENKELILNPNRTIPAYEGFDAYNFVVIKIFKDVDSKTLKSLEKYIPDYIEVEIEKYNDMPDSIEIENYADLLNIFKLRFQNRSNLDFKTVNFFK